MYMQDANGYISTYINNKVYKRMTYAQVKAYILKHGIWRGYTRGSTLNTMYDPFNGQAFVSVKDLEKYRDSWNYYNKQDYGTLTFWHK